MQLQRFDNIQEFWQVTQTYLLQDEAEHNALLGIVQTIQHYPERYPESPYLALVQNNSGILAIAIQTPPNNLLLSKVEDFDSLSLIAQDLQQAPLPGVSGLVAETSAFVQTWHTLTGQSYHRELESRIYQLTQVNPIAIAPGALRPATEGDRPLLMQWFTEFNADMDVIDNDEIRLNRK